MSVTPAIAIEKVRSSPRDDDRKGVYARFVRIDKTHGLKFYSDQGIAALTYDRQKRAAKVGLAPPVGAWVEFELSKFDKRYGYITETIVETIREYQEGLSALSSDLGNRMVRKADKIEFQLGYEIREKTGMHIIDLHWSNCGFMPNGDIVAIDFSHEM